jgi:hypothetical protein
MLTYTQVSAAAMQPPPHLPRGAVVGIVMMVGKTKLLTVDCHKTTATDAKLEDKREYPYGGEEDEEGGGGGRFGAEEVGQNQKARELAAGERVLERQPPRILSSDNALGEWYFSMYTCVSL